MRQALHKTRAAIHWPWVLGLLWVLLLFGQRDLHLLYDTHVDRRPWTVPVLELVPEENGPPMLRYSAGARAPVRGTLTATIENARHRRLATRKGHGDYRPASTIIQVRAWSWSAFFENGQPIPVEPSEPYRVCVQHRTHSLDTRVERDGKKSCTEIFNPTRREFEK